MPVELHSALFVWTILAAVAWWIDLDPQLQTVLLIVGAYHIIWRLGALFSLQFSARGQMVVPSLFNGLHRLLILAAGAAMLLLGSQTSVLLVLPIVALAVVALLAFRARSAFGRPEVEWDPHAIFTLLKHGWPFLIMGLLAVVQLRIGIILLALLGDAVAVGHYAAADRLILPVILVETLLVKAAYPALLRLWTEDRDRMREVSSRCLRFLLLFSIPASALVFAFRDVFVPILFGNDFDASVRLLVLLAWLPIVGGLRSLWSAQAITARLQTQTTMINAVSVGVLSVTALALIGQQGAAGLAIAVLASESAYVMLLYLLLARHGLKPDFLRCALRPTYAALIAVAASVAVTDLGLLIRLSTVFSTLLLALWLVGGVQVHDVRFMLGALQTKKSSI
jgi:O-antigen/teichoic acid export membrane protein